MGKEVGQEKRENIAPPFFFVDGFRLCSKQISTKLSPIVKKGVIISVQ